MGTWDCYTLLYTFQTPVESHTEPDNIQQHRTSSSTHAHTTVTMPPSKRQRTVPTSRTTKDRKTLVRRLHASIQDLATTHRYIFVFSVTNTRAKGASRNQAAGRPHSSTSTS